MKRVLHALLRYWTRPTVLTHRAGVPPGSNAVCYLLEHESRLDFLAADWAVRRRGKGLPAPTSRLQLPGVDEPSRIVFLSAAAGETSGKKIARAASLPRLVAAERQKEPDIQLVPVALYWGHTPGTEKTTQKPEKTANPAGAVRRQKLLALLFAPGHTLIQLGPKLSLRELADADGGRTPPSRLARRLQEHFQRLRLGALGPPLPNFRKLPDAIVSTARVAAAIERESRRTGAPRAALEKLARRHAKRIPARMSRLVIRGASLVLTRLWQRLYEGVQVGGMERLEAEAVGQTLVYVPTHRSHIDYLLLSYLLYHRGLALPHIASGDNLNLRSIGRILRGGGAFFMRRSFQRDRLYKAVFTEYLFYLMHGGFPVEFFIEGGRSRSGRLLRPRIGMVSMLAENQLREPDNPVLMVPVYFGYERVLEAESYMREAKGQSKRRESATALFGIFRVLNLPYGGVHVNFGEPVRLRDWLRTELGDGWRTPSAKDFRRCCERLAARLACNINAAATPTPVNLVATALLSAGKGGMTVAGLESMLRLYLALLRRVSLPEAVQPQEQTVAELLAHAESVLQLQRREERGGLLRIEPEKALYLSWYRNNTLHLFAPPSLLAALLANMDGVSREQLPALLVGPASFMLRDLSRRTEGLAEELDSLVTVFGELKLLEVEPDTGLLRPPAAPEKLRLLAGVTRPLLVRYCIFLKAGLRLLDAGEAAHEDMEKSVRFRQLCLSLAERIRKRDPLLGAELQDGQLRPDPGFSLPRNKKAAAELQASLLRLLEPDMRGELCGAAAPEDCT